jgi:hypothetical protein
VTKIINLILQEVVVLINSVSPKMVVFEPVGVQFSRLSTLLKKNPRYFFTVVPVFMMVPAMAAFTAWHQLHQPDLITTRTQEPWDKTHDHLDLIGTNMLADNLPQERVYESHIMMDYL